jgi:hypothetical protein
MVSIAYWRRGTSVRQYIGASMPPAPLLLADRWFTHRVGRVPSFSPVVGIGTPPTPHPQVRMPPFGSGGRGTLAGERGGGRVPIPTRRHTLWYSVNICTLWLKKRGGPNSSERLAYFQANRLLTELYKQETEICRRKDNGHIKI